MISSSGRYAGSLASWVVAVVLVTVIYVGPPTDGSKPQKKSLKKSDLEATLRQKRVIVRFIAASSVTSSNRSFTGNLAY